MHQVTLAMVFLEVLRKLWKMEVQNRRLSKLQTYFDVYPALVMLLPSVHSSKTGLISLFANTESSDNRFK